MNTIDFCFWLQGYFEISGDTEITKEQAQIIKDHLSLVFKHEIDPLREKQTTTPASVLNAAHSPVNDMQIRCLTYTQSSAEARSETVNCLFTK